MATREQLMQGLRSAHDAGDTDAASAIARQIQQLDSGSGQGSPPSPDASVGQPGTPPTFQQQLMKHIVNAYVAPYQQYQTAKDAMTVGLNSFSAGLLDRLSAKVSGTPLAQQQAHTEAARKELGPVLSTIASGTGYALGPGKVFGPAARFVAGPTASFAGGLVPSILEGTAAGTAQAAGEGKDLKTGAITGAVGGAAGVPIGTAGNAVIRGISEAIGARPPMPSADSLEDAESQMWGQVKGLKYSPKDTISMLRNARLDAAAEGQPMTDITNKPAVKLFDDFEEHINNNPYSTVRELTGFQDKAKALTDDNARFGNILSNRIDEGLQNAPPMTGSTMPQGMTLNQAPQAIQQAKNSSALVDQFNQNIAEPPPTALSNVANTIAGHSWSLAHHGTQPMVAPVGEALGLGGLAFEQTGHWLPAITAATATLAGQPLLNAGARGISNWQGGVSSDAANRALLGVDNPNYRDALRQILIGGATGQDLGQ